MNDLISRLAAIDRIESHIRTGDELYPLTDADKILNHAFETAASCVYNLPSAQPEIVRCKDCKYYGYNECFHGRGLTVAFDNTFCSYAERITDE